MKLGFSQQYPVTGKGAQTETQGISPERKEMLFPVWMAEPGNTLPRLAGESLSLQVFQTLSDLL